MPTKPRTRKPRQRYIPGTEPPSVPAIEKAAEAYVEARDARMSMLATEVERHDALLALMREHKLDSYEFDGQIINIVHQDRVRVKRKKESSNGTEE
jgi:hypothetical protein